jgi:hypothetical protein
LEKGDIAVFERPTRACIFEGLLASPPSTSKKLLNVFNSKDPGVKGLKSWTANELPLKSLVDSFNRLGIPTFVFSLLGDDMEEPIYNWLVRRNAAVPVFCYNTIEEVQEELKYNRNLHVIYVTEQDHAAVLGMRAKVVLPTAPWSS